MSIDVDPEWWKTLFDDIYLITDARSVCDNDLTRREVDLFCKLLPMRPMDRILDLCGGHGRHSLELSRRGFQCCTVLDFSRDLIEEGDSIATRDGLKVKFIRGDARKLDFDSSYFNHVMVLGNSLGYVRDSRADVQILSQGYRVLKPGGWILLDVADGKAVKEHFTPNAWHEIGDDILVCRQRELRRDYICAREIVIKKSAGLVRDRNYGMRLYGSESLIELIQSCGFKKAKAHRDFSPMEIEDDLGFMNHRMLITAQKPHEQYQI